MRRLSAIIFMFMLISMTLAAQSSGTVSQEPSVKGFVERHGKLSHDFRISLIDLAARQGFNQYVYAPVNDPYVGAPDWYLPYPQNISDRMKEYMEACARNDIDFIWCVCPDKDYSWSDADYGLLLGKLEMMHYMGVRSFGIFLDDVPCPADEQWRKKDLIERINAEFMVKKGMKPLLTSVDGYYVSKGEGESVKLGMYVTPEQAAADMAADVMQPFVRFIRNSRIWLDYFPGIGEDTYRFIGIDGYTREEYDSLMAEFIAMEEVPAVMARTSNKALYDEMKPWLEEFGKLGTRCRKVLECISFYAAGDAPGFWATYASNIMSEADQASFDKYPSGTEHLQSFYKGMMEELAGAFGAGDDTRVGYRHMKGKGMDTYIAPSGTTLCHLIMNNPEGREVIVRLSDESGRYTAEFCVYESYFKFDMKGDAVKVEVIGDVPVFETVFVK